MVHVTDGADVDVRLGALEFAFGHVRNSWLVKVMR
jgi:hypothetical protein